MFQLKEKLMLTEKGYHDLKKAIGACTLTNLSLMLPFGVCIQIIQELLKPFMNQEISWIKMWIYLGMGIIATLVVFLASKNDYKKTFVTSYLEAENTRISIAEQIRKLPMSFFNSKDLSELTTNMMADCANSEHVLSHIIPQLISNGISITLICIMMTIFDWRMALSMFITVPVAFLFIFGSKRLQDKLSRKHIDAKLAASDQVQEYIDGIKVIKACGLDGAKFSKLENALRYMKKMALQMEFGSGIFVAGAQMVLQAGIGLTVFVGTYLLTNGKIELIPLLMFLLTVVRVYGPILTELTLLPELFHMVVASERMRILMNTKIMEGDTQKQINNFDISFSDVSFGYSKKEMVIKNMNTTIPANGITALVGPSGCGKSTIAKLVARFWDVNQGNIKIGGIDIQSLDPEHLMSYMSFVFQDVVLFNDTIYNNIKIGNINATKEQVLEAAKAANVEDFAMKLPDGYDSLLGENGSTLSGGERQRISIARALLKNAPIVLLDEATASLDPENEVYIQQAISKLIKGKTVIVIAHRLRTIVGADKIIVIDKGIVKEEGTHEQLIQKRGLYEKLYSIQQASLNWGV